MIVSYRTDRLRSETNGIAIDSIQFINCIMCVARSLNNQQMYSNVSRMRKDAINNTINLYDFLLNRNKMIGDIIRMNRCGLMLYGKPFIRYNFQ